MLCGKLEWPPFLRLLVLSALPGAGSAEARVGLPGSDRLSIRWAGEIVLHGWWLAGLGWGLGLGLKLTV